MSVVWQVLLKKLLFNFQVMDELLSVPFSGLPPTQCRSDVFSAVARDVLRLKVKLGLMQPSDIGFCGKVVKCGFISLTLRALQTCLQRMPSFERRVGNS